ncbi:sensor histidine kinase [Roseateles amylovorans]|uniref:histidine kinase n=1 Tax=Roseateles amylovorans TaxID=2978473 RepID=A0ABY6B824_9BURK|nr:ATP-binding protein [Roseateles amylovorans]UXH80513.1 hypothetical protein N4261_11845 [Roseateles amylovorans]
MTRRSTGRASLTSVFFWITLLIVALSLAATSLMVKDIHEVRSAERLEIVADTLGTASVGPEATRLPGESLAERSRIVLPFTQELPHASGLKRARYQLVIDPYLRALPTGKAPAGASQGTPAGAPAGAQGRSPGKSLLVSQALDGMDIYLNGVWIAGLPKSDLEARYKWFRPLMAPLAQRLLRSEGPNILTIETTTWDAQVRVPPIYIGDVGSVAYVYELTNFIGSSLANASNVFCLLAGMFMLGAWLASRRDGTVFAHAGATTVIWSVLFTLVLLPRVPVRYLDLWMWAQYACIGAVVTVLTLFIFAFIEQPLSRRGRRLLFGTASAAALTYPWLGEAGRYWLDMLWLPSLLLFHLYACSQLVLHLARRRSRAAASLLAQSLLAQVFALHDHNVRLQLLQLDVGGEGWNLSHLLVTPMFLSHLSVPLLLFVVARILLGKFQANVARIRDANKILADTLQQRERELRISYNRQRDMENEVAAQGERDRIYRDLHDGIGSKLVTTLFSVRDRQINHEQLESRLLEALTDIREIISVSAPHEQRSIQEVLFTYCADLDEALSAADFQIEYELSEDGEVVLLGDQTKQLMRIVEESVANTVKYAGATRLQIRMQMQEGLLVLAIDDNGQGAAHAADRSTTPPARPASIAARVTTAEPAESAEPVETAESAEPAEPAGPAGRVLPVSPNAAAPSPLSGGRGLQGMRRRAEQMGGRYQFDRTPDGARTRLWLPLVGVDLRSTGSATPSNESAPHCSQSDVCLAPLA